MESEDGALKAQLADSIARHHVPGASLAVLRKGDIRAAVAGVINVDTGVKVTPRTIMHIGSITKVFNATLVMQLVDDGLLDLDESIARYLPDLRLKDSATPGRITARMLLNHTSGIDGELLPDQGHDEETIEKAVSRFAQLGQISPPGTEFSYCNAATVIAGCLVQRLRQRSWYRLINDRIFAPLDLRHAATLPEESLLHSASVGHYLQSAPDRRVTRTSFAFLPLGFAPAGSTLMMSASDLLRFAMAHLDTRDGSGAARILSRSSLLAMQRPTVYTTDKSYTLIDGMGLGWMYLNQGLLFHGGGGPGIVAALYLHPAQRFAAAILTNAEHGLAVINEFMAPWLAELGTSKPFGMQEPGMPERQVPIDARQYIGTYEDVMRRYQVLPGPQGLLLSRQAKFAYYENVPPDASAPLPLRPLGNGAFLLDPPPAAPLVSPAAFRVFSFRAPSKQGQMRLLGNNLRLYARVS